MRRRRDERVRTHNGRLRTVKRWADEAAVPPGRLWRYTTTGRRYEVAPTYWRRGA